MLGSSIIVMGVSACGKSTIGELLAHKLGYKFIDGDDLHPQENILKMSSGQPLNDSDRLPWLECIRDAAHRFERNKENSIIVCSALKRKYRDQIREGNQNVTFIFLDGSIDLILERIRARQGHFMQEGMVKSQFETLERPYGEPNTIFINIDAPIDEIVEQAIQQIS
ncbi:gluconokinase [Vibrio agarivorans]|uniref:Gluconokinase n=1 Tax=Vibrio agarivorans TaxID=153622 RepID=A0ABT7Y2V7_9VIBR|nr:gluconokinase [Vibrio agarivorans]MDN2482383.1 gluconokinase [Vibrio agarivorans]MDN3661928.1 gluconokinase [Vibrio agarivorans]